MINIDYSTIKSGASVEEWVRKCGAFLYVGLDGWIHIFRVDKVPMQLINLVREYGYDIIHLLKARAMG